MRRALGIAAAVALTVTTPVPVVAAAQETPTERSAAAAVIRRMNELERSLALPQLVARLTGHDTRRDAAEARARELMDRELLAMADDITRHPEVGHKEERSVKILTDYLSAHDFDVDAVPAARNPAVRARYRKGTPGPGGRSGCTAPPPKRSGRRKRRRPCTRPARSRAPMCSSARILRPGRSGQPRASGAAA